MLAGLRGFASGLHFRLLLLVFGISASVMAAQLVTDTTGEIRKIRGQRIEDALAFTQIIARSLERQFDHIELADIEEILASVRRRPEVTLLTVVDRDLTFFLDGDPKTSPIAAFHHSEVQLRSLQTGKTEHALSRVGIEVGEPLLAQGQPIGSVLIRFRNPGLAETLRPLLAGKLTAILPILVSGLLFAAGVASQITAPLRRLALAARAMAEGDLEQRIELAGASELRQLGDAFQTMIEKLKANIDQIYQLAYVDRVTKLPNREYFRMELTRSIISAERRRGSGALLFVDLDGFKQVNDSLGHDHGDKLLSAFAERVTRILRAGDTIAHGAEDAALCGAGGQNAKDKRVLARLGGDEFTILLAEIREETDAAAVASRIIGALEEPFDVAGQSLRISASIGIATFPRDGKDFQSVLKCADMAMYHAKKEGKATYRFFSAELNERVSNRMRIERDLRLALERDELELHYQPKVECRTGRISGAEALVRWRHPERGMVSPCEFIAIAEETGLILPLGAIVLKLASRQAARLHADGEKLPIAVNISMQQFDRPEFADEVCRLVAAEGASPAMIELEVTESMAMRNPEMTKRHFHQLKKAGFRFAIDDFGTGYSNLSQLSRLPFDVFKIDRSLVQGLDGGDEHGRAIVRSILALARSLDYETVAEGVETQAQLDFLAAEGGTHAQGYYFCKPMPEKDLSAWLRNRPILPVAAKSEPKLRLA
jgi:predicted signal transduction protein with EAL and GGDEF domain